MDRSISPDRASKLAVYLKAAAPCDELVVSSMPAALESPKLSAGTFCRQVVL
jgi:hypothetical protein